MRKLGKVKVFAAAAAILLGALVYTAMIPTSEALIGPGVCAYYSNGTYTKVVGARGTGCCGEVISWGITTKWVRCERLYCLDVLCPF